MAVRGGGGEGDGKPDPDRTRGLKGGRKEGGGKVCGVGREDRRARQEDGPGGTDPPPTEQRAIQGGRREAAGGGAPRVSRGSEAPRDGREPDRGDATGTRRHATHPETRRGQGASAGGAATGLRPAPKAKKAGGNTLEPPQPSDPPPRGKARRGAEGGGEARQRGWRGGRRHARDGGGRHSGSRAPPGGGLRPLPTPSDRPPPQRPLNALPRSLVPRDQRAGTAPTRPRRTGGQGTQAERGGGPRPLRSLVNDPSAGSPTETLLRLLLPLDSQVRPSSQRSARAVGRPRRGRSEGLTKPSNR